VGWKAIFEIGLDASLNFLQSFDIITYLNDYEIDVKKNNISAYRCGGSLRGNLNGHMAVWFWPSFNSRSPSRNFHVIRRMVLQSKVIAGKWMNKQNFTNLGLLNVRELGQSLILRFLKPIKLYSKSKFEFLPLRRSHPDCLR
jgi:hypothetical protein